MKFPLRKGDLALIREVIALGDRLKTMPEATPKIVTNIGRFQDVLRRLPEATPNIRAGFGFGVISYELEFKGVNRGWFVSQEPEGRDGLPPYAWSPDACRGCRVATGRDAQARRVEVNAPGEEDQG
jgi:hypothetical protein